MSIENILKEKAEKYLGLRGITYVGILWSLGAIFFLNDNGIWTQTVEEIMVYESTALVFTLLLLIEIFLKIESLKLD